MSTLALLEEEGADLFPHNLAKLNAPPVSLIYASALEARLYI